MADDNTLDHLHVLREDVRDEVKRRIQQRDQYSMQLTVALGAIAIGASSAKGTHMFFAVAPLVSIYFTALILYSYRIHDLLATYLRQEIEPEFAALCNVPTPKEWETWYLNSGQRPGVRRWFFVIEMWIVTVLSLAYVWYAWYKEWGDARVFCLLVAANVVYFILGIWASFLPRGENKN